MILDRMPLTLSIFLSRSSNRPSTFFHFSSVRAPAISDWRCHCSSVVTRNNPCQIMLHGTLVRAKVCFCVWHRVYFRPPLLFLIMFCIRLLTRRLRHSLGRQFGRSYADWLTDGDSNKRQFDLSRSRQRLSGSCS